MRRSRSRGPRVRAASSPARAAMTAGLDCLAPSRRRCNSVAAIAVAAAAPAVCALAGHGATASSSASATTPNRAWPAGRPLWRARARPVWIDTWWFSRSRAYPAIVLGQGECAMSAWSWWAAPRWAGQDTATVRARAGSGRTRGRRPCRIHLWSGDLRDGGRAELGLECGARREAVRAREVRLGHRHDGGNDCRAQREQAVVRVHAVADDSSECVRPTAVTSGAGWRREGPTRGRVG